MKSQSRIILSCMVFVTLQLTSGSPSLPSTLGCQAAEGGTVRCRDAPLGDVAHAFRILSSTSNIGGSEVILSADIADCQIPQLPTSALKGPLVVVKIIRSKMSSIYPDAFAEQSQSLRTLDLSSNSLTTIPLAISGLEVLRHLILADNRIASVEPSSIFRHLRALRLLDLSGNMLGLLEPEGARRVSTNQVNRTRMVRMSRFDLRPATATLQELNLSRNNLTELPELLTQNVTFHRLQVLDLSFNELTSLPHKFAPGTNMPKLKKIDLRNNRLKLIAPDQEPFRGKVELAGNPLHCDCSLTWLLLSQPPGATCNTPFALKDIPLTRLTSNDLCQDGSSDIMVGHDLVSLTSLNSSSITITWSVQSMPDKSQNESLEWRIVYRKLESDPYALAFSGINRTTEQVEAEARAQLKAGGQNKRAVFVDALQNLDSDTDYVVCLAAVRGTKFLMQRKRCRTVRTTEVQTTTLSSSEHVTEMTNDVVATSGQIRVTTNERKSVVTALTSKPESVTLMWRIEEKSSVEPPRDKQASRNQLKPASIRATKSKVPLKEWLLSVREFGYFHTHEEKVTEPGEPLSESRSYENVLGIDNTGSFFKTISGLRSGVPYQVCLRDLDSDTVTQSEELTYYLPGEESSQSGELCKEILTPIIPVSDWPLGTTAVLAACASAAGSSLVVALVCFFWCGGCATKNKGDQMEIVTKSKKSKKSKVKLTRPGCLSSKESFPSSSSKRSSGASTSVSSVSDGDRVVVGIGGHQVRIKDDQFKTIPYPTNENRRRWLLLPPDDEEEVQDGPDSLSSSSLGAFHPRYSLPNRKNGPDAKLHRNSSITTSPSPAQSSLWFRTNKNFHTELRGSGSESSDTTGRNSDRRSTDTTGTGTPTTGRSTSTGTPTTASTNVLGLDVSEYV